MNAPIQPPPQRPEHGKPVRETGAWFLHVIMRGNIPFKILGDIGEARKFLESYGQDDRSAVYALHSVDSSMCHITPPVGTEIVLQPSGRKMVYDVYNDASGKAVVGWRTVEDGQ